MHAAANGADGTAAGLRRFLVREARATNGEQSLAHLSWQLQQCGLQIRMFRVCNLGWAGPQPFRISSVYVLNLSPPLAPLAVELVAEDGDEPGQYLAPPVEQAYLVTGEEQRLLDQIIRLLRVGKRDSKSAKPRYGGYHRVANGTVGTHAAAPRRVLTTAPDRVGCGAPCFS